jgi:hypothetical protein
MSNISTYTLTGDLPSTNTFSQNADNKLQQQRRNKQQTKRNKLLICKAILKPVWTYVIQFWGTASTSNLEILERFQSKALRMIVDASWYVQNTVIRWDLQTPTVKEEIHRYSSQYSARLSVMNQ